MKIKQAQIDAAVKVVLEAWDEHVKNPKFMEASAEVRLSMLHAECGGDRNFIRMVLKDNNKDLKNPS